MSELLAVRGLSKSFPSGESRLEVLCDLSLRLEEGEILGITGESGSGKSTLLHLIGGMESADAGEILYRGRSLASLDERELARFRNEEVGFVFQFHHLLPEFSALENVMFPLLLRRRSFPQAEERARALLDEVGLAARAAHQPGELSGGEQQRVAIARALVGNPQLLLADEPTGNLDEKTSERIHDLIFDLSGRRGIGSILVTHRMDLAARCSRHRSMVGGRLVSPA